MLGIAAPSQEAFTSPPLPVFLEEGWDFRRDVVVLGGKGGGATVQALLARGVERVVALLPTGATDGSLPDSVKIARSKEELWRRLIEFDPPPNTVTVRKIPNGGFGDSLHLELADVIEKAVFNRATYTRKGEVWVRNFLRNLHNIPHWPSVGNLSGCFAGKACVLVSPGPSLAKNIEHLRAVQNDVLIIASNRSVAPLCEAGVKPHLAVVSDPLDLRYQLPKEYLDQVGGLVLDLVGHPKMFDLEPVRGFSFTGVPEVHAATYTRFNQDDRVTAGSLLLAGGSVATTAFRLGQVLGCTTLILVGQDLSLSGDRYYVDTAPDGNMRVDVNAKNQVGLFQDYSDDLRTSMDDLGELRGSDDIRQKFKEVKSWDGQGTVLTSGQFDLYRRYYESLLPTLPKNVTVFNCTEGGAHIEGAPHLPLKEVLAKLDSPIDNPLAVIERASEQSSADALADEVELRLTVILSGIRSALDAISQCTKLAENFTGPTCFEDLDLAEAHMSTELAKVKFVSTLCQPRIEAAQRAAANASSLQEALSASRKLYATFAEAAHRVEPLVEQALRELPTKC